MDNQQATEIQLGWLAGIIDGEGWIGFTVTQDRRRGPNKTLKVEVMVSNTDPAIVAKTADIFSLLGVNAYIRSHKALSHTRMPVHLCAVKHMTGVEKILRPIRDYLTGNKQERTDLILRFIELRRVNPGSPNPHYANGATGRFGPRTLFSYTAEELALFERCRELQNPGASETTRAARDKAVRDLIRSNAERREAATEKI